MTLPVLLEEHRKAMETFVQVFQDPDLETLRATEPVYSLLDLKIQLLELLYEECRLCPHRCGHSRYVLGVELPCGSPYPPDAVAVSRPLDVPEEFRPAVEVLWPGRPFPFLPALPARWGDEDPVVQIAEGFGAGARVAVLGEDALLCLRSVLETLRQVDLAVPTILKTYLYTEGTMIHLLPGCADLIWVHLWCANDACGEKVLGVVDYWKTVRRNLESLQWVDLLVDFYAIPGHEECCLRPFLQYFRKRYPNYGLRVHSRLPFRVGSASWVRERTREEAQKLAAVLDEYRRGWP